ncbi:MAG: TonB-dependent receptor, plug, partial [Candidatus Solibacter sp.]|nr:TonB-dependent receptor, plug [Candidatus Solibacter sp.]
GFKSAGGGSVLINTVSVEALAEFKSTGSAFSAEYGRTGGGVVSITTRSGTNRFHGTLFEYFRNDKLDANDFFSNQNGLGKPPLRWNQFGGNIGGPIKKDRLFFFFNYEGAQVKRVSKITGNTATPALLAAVQPAIRSMLDFYLPKTYTPTSNIYIGAHVRNDRQVNDENTYLSHGDALLGAHRLGLRHSYNHQDYKAPTLSPNMPTVYPMRFQNAVVQDTWTIKGTQLNELRVGLNRVDLDRHAENLDQIPAWITAGSLNASLSSFIHFLSTTYTVADNFSQIHGAHTLKAGFEIRELRSARFQGGPPTYTYNNTADLISAKPLSVGLLFGGGKGLHTRNYGFYGQDEWRVSRHLQVNLGLRYEYAPPLRGGFNINSSDPFGPFTKPGQAMFRADRNDWAPRAGLVWVPGADQRTAIRVGGAISYLMPQAIHFYDMAYINPALPFNTTFSAADVPAQYLGYPVVADFTNQVEANPALLPASFRLSRSVADYNHRDTYVGMWNLSVQHRVTSLLGVQASYVGQRTVKLISVRPLNLVDPVTKVRPDQSLGQINVEENAANIAYHAMELSLNQKTWRGLRTDAYLTWAKSIGYYNPDDTITFTGGSLQDPNNIAGSKGPVRGMPLLRYTSVLSYEIPGGNRLHNRFLHAAFGGWTFRTINTLRGGIPINVVANSDIVGNGRSAGQRPDPVAGVDPYERQGLVWLNPAAFTTVYSKAEKRFGYLGFNALRGPSALTLNAALHKTFMLHEQQRLTFRLETFNTLNHPVLSAPVLAISDPNFGKIQTASGGRNVQLALKYVF